LCSNSTKDPHMQMRPVGNEQECYIQSTIRQHPPFFRSYIALASFVPL
jgi:hypothetical protein